MASKSKTNTAAKAETKTTKVAPAKVEEAKVEAVKTEVKEEAKAEPAKKTAAKKTTETKATETKTVKAAEKKTEFFVQFSGLEFSYDDLLEKVKADYIAQTGKKTFSSTKVYVKPEEKMVYYVVNEKFAGSVYLG